MNNVTKHNINKNESINSVRLHVPPLAGQHLG